MTGVWFPLIERDFHVMHPPEDLKSLFSWPLVGKEGIIAWHSSGDLWVGACYSSWCYLWKLLGQMSKNLFRALAINPKVLVASLGWKHMDYKWCDYYYFKKKLMHYNKGCSTMLRQDGWGENLSYILVSFVQLVESDILKGTDETFLWSIYICIYVYI